MSTITSNAYYQLPTSSQGQTQTQTQSSSSSSISQLVAALDDADNANNTSGDSSDGGDILDLSPEAQNILNQSPSAASTGSTGSSSSNDSFLLTTAQQQQISQILAKYQGAPMTQDTYNQIQNDLQAAGLSPQQLGMEDSVNNFNSTQIFLDALNGVTDPLQTPGSNSADEQTKEGNYMQQIYNEWQGMDTSTSSDSSASSSPAGVAPAQAS